jgi:hypothetical protein
VVVRLGSLFFGCIGMSLLPFASMVSPPPDHSQHKQTRETKTHIPHQLASAAPDALACALSSSYLTPATPPTHQSLFIYDRQFYSKDSAAGLYSVLPYYFST